MADTEEDYQQENNMNFNLQYIENEPEVLSYVPRFKNQT